MILVDNYSQVSESRLLLVESMWLYLFSSNSFCLCMYKKLWMFLYSINFTHTCPLYPNITPHSKLTTNYQILKTNTYKNDLCIPQVKVLVPGLHLAICDTSKSSLFQMSWIKSPQHIQFVMQKYIWQRLQISLVL